MVMAVCGVVCSSFLASLILYFLRISHFSPDANYWRETFTMLGLVLLINEAIASYVLDNANMSENSVVMSF